MPRNLAPMGKTPKVLCTMQSLHPQKISATHNNRAHKVPGACSGAPQGAIFVFVPCRRLLLAASCEVAGWPPVKKKPSPPPSLPPSSKEE